MWVIGPGGTAVLCRSGVDDAVLDLPNETLNLLESVGFLEELIERAGCWVAPDEGDVVRGPQGMLGLRAAVAAVRPAVAALEPSAEVSYLDFVLEELDAHAARAAADDGAVVVFST